MNQFYETPTPQPDDNFIYLSEQTWYCFQIPKVETQEKMTLIGMIDASGSMENIWPKLAKKWNKFIQSFESVYTITFSESPLIRTPQLQENIYYHGGFQTNIQKSFIGLHKLLQSNKPKYQNITIVFISDAVEECSDQQLHQEIQALNLNELFRIQFICVGIGKHFPPTFASRMRNIFNQTHYATPILITIDADSNQVIHHSRVIIKNISLRIAQVSFPQSKRFIESNYVQVVFLFSFQFPWDKQGTTDVYSDSYVFATKSQLIVEFNQQKYELTGQSKPQIKDCIKISKIWNSQLSILAQISNQSQSAQLALQILKQFSNQKNFKLSVWERIQLYKCNQNQVLFHFMSKIQKIYMNQMISNLSEKEQFSRKKIHTLEHKYHSQGNITFILVIQMAGLSSEEFLEAKEEFIMLLQENRIENKSNQECSIVSMQNTVDILLQNYFNSRENDIIHALNECQNQYELVQCFPLIGQGLQIQREKSTVFSEYQIKVLSMARHHKTIDSISMLQKGYEIHLQTGNGDEEIINCIIPLFEKEEQLSPFISSKLYNMLLSYNITLNIDTFLAESYISVIIDVNFQLLASCLVYLICQKPSNWQKKLLNQIKCTFFMLNSHKNEIIKIKNQLQQNPNECFITVNFEEKFQCQCTTKILLIAFCYDLINFQIIQRIFLEQIGRSIDRDIKISDYFEFFEPPFMEQEFQKIDVSVIKEFVTRNFYSFSELNVQVVHAYDDKLLNLVKKMEIKPPELRVSKIKELLKPTVLEYSVLQQILKFFCNTYLSKEQLIVLIYHAYCNAKSVQRNRTQLEDNLELIFDEIRLAKYKPYIKQQKIEKLQFLKQLFQREMENVHKIQKPLTLIQIKFMPNLKLHPQIGIVINACMSADCPHYLEVRSDYDRHVQSNYSCFLPNSIYQVIYQCRKESMQQIFDKISQNLACRKIFLQQLLKDPLIVYLKIKDAQQVYNTYQ